MINPSISQANSLIGRSIGDHNRYQIESHLGEGGMGEVYQATDIRLGKVVAIKLLRATSTHASTTSELDFKRRFERECAICAALKSENIVQVSDYGITDEGYPFYVMECLEGQTLEKALKQEKSLSVKRTINIVTQICAGLRSAHRGVTIKSSDMGPDSLVKVIHRDLKPANIFLVPTLLGERVKIIDFGVAKIQSSYLKDMNSTTFFLGTYHYAAPEQFNSQDIDERVDIYCLGIILYEMLAGVDPFGLKLPGQIITSTSWIKAHLYRSVQPLRSQAGCCESLSLELEQIVMRCLEKNPEKRFSTVQALAQALESVQNTVGYNLISRDLPKQNSVNEPQYLSLISSYIQKNEIYRNLKLIFIKAFELKNNLNLFQLPSQLKHIEEFSKDSLSNSSLSTPSTSSPFIYLELINKCQAELALYIGPIAKLVVEQTLDDINLYRTQNFIESLAIHIPDINAASRFRQTFSEENVIPPS